MTTCLEEPLQREKTEFIWLHGGKEEGFVKHDFVVSYLVDVGNSDSKERNDMDERGWFCLSRLDGGVGLGEHSNDKAQYTTGDRAWVNYLGTEDH